VKPVRYEAPGDFAVADVPMPAVGPLDVQIKINQTGVCGTDLHLHHETYFGVYTLTPGHETIGEVDEVSSEVTRFQPGQRLITGKSFRSTALSQTRRYSPSPPPAQCMDLKLSTCIPA
jgi:D-arabinitol dehydrogenase (NADP+)